MYVIHNTILGKWLFRIRYANVKEQRPSIRIIYNFDHSLKKFLETLQILTVSSEAMTQSLLKKYIAIPTNIFVKLYYLRCIKILCILLGTSHKIFSKNGFEKKIK